MATQKNNMNFNSVSPGTNLFRDIVIEETVSGETMALCLDRKLKMGINMWKSSLLGLDSVKTSCRRESDVECRRMACFQNESKTLQ